MPFTPSHIAAIVPIARLSRAALPFSALAIGSMIPDLPLFVPLPTQFDYPATHSLPGLVTACLPLGLVVYGLYHGFMKLPLTDLLPRAILSRLVSLARSSPDRSWAMLGTVAIAIVLGALTHVFWDSFTHHDRWGTRLFPALERPVLTLAGQPVLGYKVLQYGSSIVALPILLFVLARWLSRREPAPQEVESTQAKWQRLAFWSLALAIPVSATIWVILAGRGSLYEQIGRAVKISGLGLMVAILAYCFWERRLLLFQSRKWISVAWGVFRQAVTLLSLSSYFCYTTAGFDFETATATGVDVLYLRLRWDDGSTWAGSAIQPCPLPSRQLDWFDPGGTLFATSTHPLHQTRWNDLGFWNIDNPSRDPYLNQSYPGARSSRWWACPSWLIILGCWHRAIGRSLRGLKILAHRSWLRFSHDLKSGQSI